LAELARELEKWERWFHDFKKEKKAVSS
jgi:hypothetical protein